MGLFISVVTISLLFLGGCATTSGTDVKQENTKQENDKAKHRSASDAIKAFEERKNKRGNVPALVLPPAYESVSVFSNEKITLSAQNVQYANLLHSVAKIAGLNLIIDEDVPTNLPITLSVQEADTKEVLDILMDISGTYYILQGNILHVKQFITKSMMIPYTHTTTSFKTDLGGDVLSSASSGSGSGSGGGGSDGIGMKGDFSLKFENPDKINNFYEQIEENLASLLSQDGKYTFNKFSGILTVRDKYKNVQAIEKFIDRIKSQVQQQVLIEAKILEVILNKDHSLGVSWEAVADSVGKSGGNLLVQQGLALAGSVAGTVTYTNDNFSAIINAIDSSGDVDTLSNPRIKVLSGQSAIISSGKLVPFWEKEVQTNQGTGGSASNTQVTYNRRDVLHGLTMGVTPTVLEDGRIMLNVIPITSSIEDVIQHYDENGKSVASAPVLNVKEAGTVIYAKDNDLVLIGGLINNTVSKEDKSIPFLGDLPYIGSLFQQKVNKNEKRELVILIRLKVIK